MIKDIKNRVFKKNVIKTILSLALILLIVSTSMINYATVKGFSTIENNIKPSGPNQEIYNAGADILGVIQFICVAILLAGLMIGGIGMVTSAGNPKKKADAKGAMIAVLIGSALVLVPTTIIKTIADTSTNLSNGIK